MLLAVQNGLVDEGLEVSPAGGDPRLRDKAHKLLSLAPVPDEVRDRNHVQVVLTSEPTKLRLASHAHLVFVDDLAEDSSRVQPSHPGEIDGGLSVARSLEHAALASFQREDVAGTGEVSGAGSGVHHGEDGGGTVIGRDAGGGVVAVVDAHEKRSPHALGVGLHHGAEIQFSGAFGGDRGADEA